MPALEQSFYQLICKLCPAILANEVAILWKALADQYQAKGRHYHNLHHLEKMFSELGNYPIPIYDQDALLLSIFYHDIIYNPSRKDNEVKSAETLQKLLLALGIEPLEKYETNTSLVKKTYAQIVATKDHLIPVENDDPDLGVLLDIDLAILGSDPEQYQAYTTAIRQEYRRYPDLLYYPARRKAMRKFLARPSIYHTAFFRSKYEVKARKNIERFDL